MQIAKYDPFRDLRGLQNDVNRLFAGAFPVNREEVFNGALNPKVDIYENAENLVLEAELPGLTRDDFELSFESNVITLKGERKFEKKEDGDNYHRVERAYGAFTRSFSLPPTVTVEGVKAEFNNGILRVALPKREETKARKIEVTGGDTAPKTIETENIAQTASA